ncbi:hypothetical protein GXW82_18885 [Streptacidiphilus sp. 4-A2]|nr:hypothetical protein [Streptacidiphilus sp. 4-A2]
MTNNEEPMLNSAAQAGLKNYTAAFVISSGCNPIWGDTLPVDNDPTLTQEIATAKADGATPIVSFGGAAAPNSPWPAPPRPASRPPTRR